jgi:tRNA(fMet)-specific endonuclease VapC
MPYLLDTNICIALLRGTDSNLAERVAKHTPDDFRLCSIVKGELTYGARRSDRVEKNLINLARFCKPFRSVPFDDAAADFYGTIRSILEKEGQQIGANDLLIASIALAHDLTVLTRNRDEFMRVPNLRLTTW